MGKGDSGDLARSFNEIPISDRWAAGFMLHSLPLAPGADGGFPCSNVGSGFGNNG
jgi:hypothetical protein